MADILQKLKEKRDKLKDILANIKTSGDNLDKMDGDLEVIKNSLDATIEHFSPGGAGSEAEGWKPAAKAKDDEISALNKQIREAKQKVIDNLTSNTASDVTLYQLLEQLENQLKDITKERDDLKKKIGDFDKVVDDIGGDIDKVGDETDKLKGKTEATKNKVADLAVKGLAVLGFFAGAFWAINWVKNLVNGRKRSP